MVDRSGATHYEVLGIPRHAPTEEVRRAFRSRAKALHPDAGGDSELFRRLREAHDTLVDIERRARYDHTLPAEPVSTVPPGGGWTGRDGGFTGEVEFPPWLRGVTDAVWEDHDHVSPGRRAAGAAERTVPTVALAVLWRWEGPVTGRPVAAGADVLLPADEVVVRLDAVTGTVRWHAGLAAPVAVPPIEAVGADGAPTVVVWSADGHLHGLDPARGVTRWEHGAGLPTAPTVAGHGSVLLARADHHVELVDPTTGGRRWSARVAAAPTATLLLDGQAAGLALVVSDDVAEAVDVRRGRHRWRQRLPVTIDLPPVALGGAVLLAEAGGTLCRIDPATGAVQGGWDVGSAVAGVATDGRRLLVTTARPPQLLALTPTGRVHWATALDEIDLEPAVVGRWGHLLGRSGELRVVDLADGTVRARAATGIVPHGPPVAVSTARGTVLVLRDEAGSLTAVAAP